MLKIRINLFVQFVHHICINHPGCAHSPTGPVFVRAWGNQNGRGQVFPVILARQEPQRYKNEILVVESQVIPQMKAVAE